MITLTWPMISLIVGLFITWNGVLVGIGKILIARIVRDFDLRLSQAAGESGDLKQIALDLTQLRVELPIAYQRREDSIREMAVFSARLDALAGAQQQFVLRDDFIRSEVVLHAKLDAMAERIQKILENGMGKK